MGQTTARLTASRPPIGGDRRAAQKFDQRTGEPGDELHQIGPSGGAGLRINSPEMGLDGRRRDAKRLGYFWRAAHLDVARRTRSSVMVNLYASAMATRGDRVSDAALWKKIAAVAACIRPARRRAPEVSGSTWAV